MLDFAHLHTHTQYSLLDGANDIKKMMKKAKADGMKAVAMTDHGNMFGAFEFVKEAEAAEIKPIVGCEFYLVADRHKKSFVGGEKDKRYHQLLLAKNKIGYQNLSKLCSLGYIEGLYSKYPRIDKELLLQYHEGLICTSCCLGAEIPQAILFKTETEAEELFRWWLNVFGDDFYVEIQRHNIENIDQTGKSQEDVNQVLMRFANKYNVKIIATNDAHYLNKKDAEPHDILLCVNTAELRSTPKGYGRGQRFAFPNDKFYFKTKAEMYDIFKDVPQSLENTIEIVDKIDKLKLKQDVLMPAFPLPPNFTDANQYLRHLTFEGAKRKYKTYNAEVEQRLNYELDVMEKMGFAGYFLIVQDFINAARHLGVRVGLGRGSAAGSAVAYCIGITNIEPMQYNLLFERFLNPERVSMPDIDTDFDDLGRQKVIDYVVNKYGKNQVAQIGTFGTMAARGSIKDVARVLGLPLSEANQIVKLVPEKAGTTLEQAIRDVPEFAQLLHGNDLAAETINMAIRLEGSVRNSGVHAAGIIISKDDIMNTVPVMTAKDSDLWVTQFEGKYIESAGMLKMDFLGLKTLTIISDALEIIKKRHNTDIEIDDIPLNDPKTYKLYQDGSTVGTFQFESEGMRTYLRDLKPTNIEDLIAMNALYRPGPMDYIPQFIDCKQGRKKVEYPHPLLEPILKDTYGIMVYQEQIMQTGQVMGGFTLGGADVLRRAMGKKDAKEMERQKIIFVEGASKKGIPESKSTEVFEVMQKFAEYGFNKSHSAAYSVLAYQTGYLKANYTAEYMAAVLTNNMSDIKKISIFMEECKRIGVAVLPPDVNESEFKFVVNAKGEIKFGLGAVKGVGENAVEHIVLQRKNGLYKSIFGLMKRMDTGHVGKKALESLAYSGAFDGFGLHRSQYFYQSDEREPNTIEKAIRFGKQVQESEQQAGVSLFGGIEEIKIQEPMVLECQEWDLFDKLQKEKEVVGIYISGHPLDDYRELIKSKCNFSIEQIQQLKGEQTFAMAGIVSALNKRYDKNGKAFCSFTIEDFTESMEIALFSKDYEKFNQKLEVGQMVYLKAKNQLRWNSADQFQLNVLEIEPLENAYKLINKLTLGIKTNAINAHNAGLIKQILETNSGHKPIEIWFIDNEGNVKSKAKVSRFEVDITTKLIKELAIHRDFLRFSLEDNF